MRMETHIRSLTPQCLYPKTKIQDGHPGIDNPIPKQKWMVNGSRHEGWLQLHCLQAWLWAIYVSGRHNIEKLVPFPPTVWDFIAWGVQDRGHICIGVPFAPPIPQKVLITDASLNYRCPRLGHSPSQTQLREHGFLKSPGYSGSPGTQSSPRSQ